MCEIYIGYERYIKIAFVVWVIPTYSVLRYTYLYRCEICIKGSWVVWEIPTYTYSVKERDRDYVAKMKRRWDWTLSSSVNIAQDFRPHDWLTGLGVASANKSKHNKRKRTEGETDVGCFRKSAKRKEIEIGDPTNHLLRKFESFDWLPKTLFKTKDSNRAVPGTGSVTRWLNYLINIKPFKQWKFAQWRKKLPNLVHNLPNAFDLWGKFV